MNKKRLEEIKQEVAKYVNSNEVPEMSNLVLLIGSMLEAILEK